MICFGSILLLSLSFHLLMTSRRTTRTAHLLSWDKKNSRRRRNQIKLIAKRMLLISVDILLSEHLKSSELHAGLLPFFSVYPKDYLHCGTQCDMWCEKWKQRKRLVSNHANESKNISEPYQFHLFVRSARSNRSKCSTCSTFFCSLCSISKLLCTNPLALCPQHSKWILFPLISALYGDQLWSLFASDSLCDVKWQFNCICFNLISNLKIRRMYIDVRGKENKYRCLWPNHFAPFN